MYISYLYIPVFSLIVDIACAFKMSGQVKCPRRSNSECINKTVDFFFTSCTRVLCLVERLSYLEITRGSVAVFTKRKVHVYYRSLVAGS